MQTMSMTMTKSWLLIAAGSAVGLVGLLAACSGSSGNDAAVLL